MEHELKTFIDGNAIIKKYFQYPKEELEVIRMLINLRLIYIQRDPEKRTTVRSVKICVNENYNYLDFIVSFIYKVDSYAVSTEEFLDVLKVRPVCEYCKCNKCIKNITVVLMDEIDKYNANQVNKISYIDVIDYILNRKSPEFKSIPEKNFFSAVNLIDLIYVQVILENDLIFLSQYDENRSIAEFNYLDLTNKTKNEYYINVLIDYYKTKNNVKHLKIDTNNVNPIFNEKDNFFRIYKIAAYYKYLIEIKKIDIIKKLREILKPENNERGMKLRSHYFVYKSFQKVEQLPYNEKSKDKIYSILNYILNYRYKKGTPFIPINILIYSNDKEGVENICKIIGEFMWFFGYLLENMRYYNEYMNNIILEKVQIKRLYYDDGNKKKNGILLLHNFENLLYTDYLQQNLILNILTDEMEKNNNSVCTIIYGERDMLKPIISNHYKLSQRLINLELEIDDLNIDKVNDLVIEKLEKSLIVSDTVKVEIYNYIKATYAQSDIQNMEYVNKLYNRIILNMNNDFSMYGEQELTVKDIPDAYNTRDLPTIMEELNSLVGLSEIKEQVNDLVALLKFN